LEGAVLTETVFAWPGLGTYITNSLFAADVKAVLSSTLVIGLVYVTLNMLSEHFQKLFDPRSARRS
jgi:peptide/nickel transport system permease protein